MSVQFIDKESILDLVPMVRDLPKESEQAYQMATTLYSEARRCEKILESERKSLGEPLRKELIKINDKAKELSEPLSKIISLCNEYTSSYVKFLDGNKKSQEEKIREAASMFDMDVYIEPMEAPVSSDAQVVSKKIKKYRLSDFSKIPREYLMIDEDAINKALKMGIDCIEGLEIYVEEKISLRSR